MKWFVRFQYGTTPNLGTTTAGQFSTGTVSTNLTGLAASTTYYYRCVAKNMGVSSGAVYGPIQTFTTGAGNPPAITNPTSSTVATGARSLPFSFQVSASNGATAFSATGLPPGVSIHPSTGVISGSPALMGSYFATITASNAAGSGSAFLPITLSSESQGWRMAWFGANATNTGNAADAADPTTTAFPTCWSGCLP